MKFLLLFFTLSYLISRTCNGQKINHLNVIFVSNVVDPNDYEMETLKKLVSYPFIKWTNSSLMTRFGLLVNYSIIFSSNPDNIITLRGLDMDRYSTHYFETIINNQTTNSCQGKSLKGLRKALDITPPHSIILMAANRKPTDAGSLIDIFDKMVDDVIRVIIFQIDDDGSIAEIPNLNNEINANYYIPENLKRNKKKPVHEFGLIMRASAIVSTLIPREAKLAENDTINWAKRDFVFVIDVPRPTKDDINEISQSMEKFVHFRYQMYTDFSVMFSNDPDNLISFDILYPYPYDASYYRSILEYHLVNTTIREPTLKGLRNSLKLISTFPWIVYYVKNLPIDNHLFLPEIIQLIYDKKVQVKISIHGRNNSGRKTVPVLYRTILDASKMATSRLNETNWIEAVYVPRNISNHVESRQSSTVPSRETTQLKQKGI